MPSISAYYASLSGETSKNSKPLLVHVAGRLMSRNPKLKGGEMHYTIADYYARGPF